VIDAKPSKSAKKRQYLELQNLGEQLMTLTDQQLDSIDTDEYLIDQVRLAKATSANGALRRQKQLIGKIMRHVDPDPIREALHLFGHGERAEKGLFRDSEQWRDQLARDGASALKDFRETVNPECDELARLVTEHLSARDTDSRRRFKRQMFREVHRILSLKVQNTSI
jgi:ribosome-associated protein